MSILSQQGLLEQEIGPKRCLKIIVFLTSAVQSRSFLPGLGDGDGRELPVEGNLGEGPVSYLLKA